MENHWNFAHLGIIVRNMDKAVDYYSSLGIAAFQREFMLDSRECLEYKEYGKTPATPQKIKIRLGRIGSYQIELIQPLEGGLIYEEFLNNKGEGAHHIAFTVENLTEETAGLTSKGVPIVLAGKLASGHHFHYFDTGMVGGTIIELIEPPHKSD
jgi:catechol 2,3-dioxygenase-like lactoylglutathione lyase family enzyme